MLSQSYPLSLLPCTSFLPTQTRPTYSLSNQYANMASSGRFLSIYPPICVLCLCILQASQRKRKTKKLIKTWHWRERELEQRPPDLWLQALAAGLHSPPACSCDVANPCELSCAPTPPSPWTTEVQGRQEQMEVRSWGGQQESERSLNRTRYN
jgi:hypothetical protein